MDDTARSAFDPTEIAVDIIAAFISNNSLPAAELPALIVNVHAAVTALANGGSATSAPAQLEEAKATPAQIRKSITPEALISFIDGKSYKTLKRHLGNHDLDAHSYRARFGLPSDYPMVASNYAAQRSALAKSIGLGRFGKAAQPAAESKASAAPARKPRARKGA